jgi:hypothetical protein
MVGRRGEAPLIPPYILCNFKLAGTVWRPRQPLNFGRLLLASDNSHSVILFHKEARGGVGPTGVRHLSCCVRVVGSAQVIRTEVDWTGYQIRRTGLVPNLRAGSWSCLDGEEQALAFDSVVRDLSGGVGLPQTLPHVPVAHHDSVDCPRGRALVTQSSSSTSNSIQSAHRTSDV